MTHGPQIAMLPDGRRMHLHHGPIDLIVEAWGAEREAALGAAAARFSQVLDELVGELAALRVPLGARPLVGAVARRMERAVRPFGRVFITPMAAVAGAVADEICETMCAGRRIERAYVNNGGDIAIHLAAGQALTAAIHARGDAGRVRLRAADPVRGLATSGWRGRSHSLGIADAVTVVARTAAAADAAATLIANAVDLPGHPQITRRSARALAPESDLGDRLVTVAVGPLGAGDIANALRAGTARAGEFLARGLIAGACLRLCGRARIVGVFEAPAISRKTGSMGYAGVQASQDAAVSGGNSP